MALMAIRTENERGETCIVMVNARGQVLLVPESQVQDQSARAGIREGDEGMLVRWLASAGWRFATLDDVKKHADVIDVKVEHPN